MYFYLFMYFYHFMYSHVVCGNPYLFVFYMSMFYSGYHIFEYSFVILEVIALFITRLII